MNFSGKFASKSVGKLRNLRKITTFRGELSEKNEKSENIIKQIHDFLPRNEFRAVQKNADLEDLKNAEKLA